jgi:hypothetical protein
VKEGRTGLRGRKRSVNHQGLGVRSLLPGYLVAIMKRSIDHLFGMEIYD